jgi:hypothetical protein
MSTFLDLLSLDFVSFHLESLHFSVSQDRLPTSRLGFDDDILLFEFQPINQLTH